MIAINNTPSTTSARVTTKNAADTIDYIQEQISDVNETIFDYRNTLAVNPRGFFRMRVESNLAESRRDLRNLKRRKANCLRLLGTM